MLVISLDIIKYTHIPSISYHLVFIPFSSKEELEREEVKGEGREEGRKKKGRKDGRKVREKME